jgi:PAS domain S-box-containing protein
MEVSVDGSIDVLHVDDDPAFTSLVSDVLTANEPSFSVVSETSPDDALPHVDAVDCVVSDYDMPGTTGLDFLRTVKAQDEDLPFVLYTGKGSEEIASEAISAGVDDYLQKGGGTEQYDVLANRIKNLVAQTRAQVAAERTRERYYNLIETAPTPVALFDADRRLIYLNDQAVSLLDAESADDVLGMEMEAFVHPDDHETVRERSGRILKEDVSVDPIDIRVQTVTGETRVVRVAAAPGTYEGGPVVQSVLVDLTEYH